MPTDAERRLDTRLPLQRRVKLVCTQTGRCVAGETCDYSSGGALVQLDPGAAAMAQWQPGRDVRVGIDWTGRQSMFIADLLPTARVVRSADCAGRRRIALAFVQRQPLAASA
jgi:hypothetical protein